MDSIHKMFLTKDKPMSQLIVRKFYLTLLLWMLSKEEMHGYEIIKRMEALDMGYIKASRIYPFLKELESAGLVLHKKEGRRKVYKATKKGVEVLKKIRSYLSKSPLADFLKELVS